MKLVNSLLKSSGAAPVLNLGSVQLVRLWLPLTLILALIFVSAWLLDINQSDYIRWQRDAFLLINHSLYIDSSFWLNVTQLGDAMVLFPLLSFLVLRYPQLWAALFGAIPVSTLLSHGGKNFFNVPRPAMVLDNNLFHIMGDTLTAHNSLPSRHTVTIFTAVTVVLGVLIPRPCKKRHYLWLLMGAFVAFMIGISRVVVGAHWPLDVVFGALFGFLGGLSGIALTQCSKCWWKWLESSRCYVITSLVLLLFVVAIVFQMSRPENVDLIVLWGAAAMGGLISFCLLLENRWTRRNKAT